MWKDMDVYYRRDDDSAIGDSPNHSAEEESLNSRRKSEASDDASDTSLETHSHLHSKFGIQIPTCLLKDGEKNTEVNRLRSKRTSYLTNGSATNSKSSAKKPAGKNKSNKDDLQLQLQYLLGEMRNLRELDRDILLKFVNLNDCIEEVRWRLAENEAKFQRKLAEDDADEDFFSTLTENRLGDWDEAEMKSPKEGSDVTKPFFREPSLKSPISPKAKVPPQSDRIPPRASIRKAESAFKSSPSPGVASHPLVSESPNHTNSSLVDGVRSNSASKQQASKADVPNAVSSIQLQKVSDDNYYRFKSPHSNPSDVWVAREKVRTQNQVIRRKSAKESNPQDHGDSKKPVRSASMLAKKYNDLIQQQSSRATSNPPDSAKSSRRVQWSIKEKEGPVKVSDFQKQREYQNLIGLSRVRGMGQIFTPGDKTPVTTAQSIGPSGPLNSGSSSPSLSRGPVARSSSYRHDRDAPSQLKRDSPRRNARGFQSGNNNNNNNGRTNLMIINNYCNQAAAPFDLVMSRDVDVLAAVSHRGASSSTMFQWIRQQDDVTSYS